MKQNCTEKDRARQQRALLQAKREASSYTGVPITTIEGRSRLQKFARARHIAIYLAREAGGISFPDLASSFNQTHKAPMHAVKKAAVMLEQDEQLRGIMPAMLSSVKEAAA